MPRALNEQLRPAYDAGNVVIDFGGVRYFDSTAIGVLFKKRRVRSESGLQPAVFAGLYPTLRRVFTLVGMDEIWTFVDSVEEAFALLKTRAA